VFRNIATLLLLLIVAAALFMWIKQDGQITRRDLAGLLEKKETRDENDTKGVVALAPAFAQDGETLIADVSERSVGKVVNIFSEKVTRIPGRRPFGPFFNDPFFRRFFGEGLFEQHVPRERRERSLGSGVVVDSDGVIITNHHVIDGAKKIKVTFTDKREFDAEVAGKDKETDLAVLKLDGAPHDLQPISYGDSDSLRLGDIVLAVGNPFGVGHTVTMGIVSAKGRANVGIVDYEDFIQTDAAINPGNSGGALVNMRGELVGINTAILSRTGGYQGVGFAIPSNMARRIAREVLDKGKVTRGWLGVVIQDINGDLAGALGLSEVRGVLISDVMEDSPAERGGLERGDVVLKVDEKTVDSTGRLRNLIAIAGADRDVVLTVLRDGEQKTLEVTLGEKEAGQAAAAGIDEDEGTLGGLTVEPLTPANRKRYEVPTQVENGLVITAVKPGSPAQFAGFRPGDVIREVNRRPVESVGDLKKNYEEAGKMVAVLVQRGRTALFLALPKE
jgi:serine protease Do